MLYAQSQSRPCSGDDLCYWCGSPCDRKIQHGVPKAEVGTKKTQLAKNPGGNWICNGCNLWRRPLVTVRFHHGAYVDRRCPMDYSWFITDTDALAVQFAEANPLYKVLLDPPLRFCLSLIDVGEKNQIQYAEVNDLQEIKADTPLKWTLNNKPFRYTVYELEVAMKQGTAGVDPGVRELMRRLGPPKAEPLVSLADLPPVDDDPATPPQPPQEKRKRGRPPMTDEAKAARRTIKTLAGSAGLPEEGPAEDMATESN